MWKVHTVSQEMHEHMGLWHLTLSSCADVLQGLVKLLHCLSNTALLVFLPLLRVADDTNGSYSAA